MILLPLNPALPSEGEGNAPCGKPSPQDDYSTNFNQ